MRGLTERVEVERIDLVSQGSISPRTWRYIEQGGGVNRVFEGKVTIKENTFVLQSYVSDGEEVQVFCKPYFYCVRTSDIDAQKRKNELRQHERQARRRLAEQARREEIKAAHKALALDVAWRSVYRNVLSGLSERSASNGANRRTVIHIQLEEALEFGRLKRNAGDLLCRRSNGSFDVEESDEKVSCKRCLEIAERVAKEPHGV